MKEHLNKYFQNPIILGAAVLVLATAFFRLLGDGINFLFFPNASDDVTGIVAESVKLLTLFPVIFMAKKWLNKRFTFGFQKANIGKSILLALPLLLLILISIKPNIQGSALQWAAVTIMAVSAGVFEEGVVRGFILTNFMYRWKNKPHYILKSVVLSSVIFGLIHFVNLNRAAFLPTLVQVIYAMFLGAAFGAVFIRTHNLWGGIIAHALIDFSNDLPRAQAAASGGQNGASMILEILICAVFLLYGLFLIRPKKIPEIEKVWQQDPLFAEGIRKESDI